jgi:glycosyltransferase involved in cell wall biosynthesis
MDAARETSDGAPRTRRHGGAILVLPTTLTGERGPVAAGMSTAGWARGFRRALGDAWIVTPVGVMDPDELRRRASDPSLLSVPGGQWRNRIPLVPKTALKDLREWRRAKAFRVDASAWRNRDVALVWQRHELFQTGGPRLAVALGVPSVLFVPAPLVWQASQWRVQRPGWGKWIERVGEGTPMCSADVVACGSATVAEQVRRIGVEESRIVITPTGTDPSFSATSPNRDRESTRRRLGLEGRFVVGWVGSFRRFHALEYAVDALVGIESATLLLVGDGPERSRIEQLARDRHVTVQCTGTLPHDEIPEHLAAMDVALVLAAEEQPFHYSPLKLAEYLAAGVAVIAPRVGALQEQLDDGVDALLVNPGNTQQLAAALRRLKEDPDERDRLGRAASATASDRWSWDRSVEVVLAAIDRSREGEHESMNMSSEEHDARGSQSNS